VSRTGADTVYVGVAVTTDHRGDSYFNGASLALERLNATRAPGTHPLGMRRPKPGTPDVLMATTYRDDPAVIGVVGHTGSAGTMDAAPIYADIENQGRRALVAVSPTATNPQVTRTTRWVFRVCPTDEDAARALGRFAAESLHAQRVAVVFRDDLFGRGVTHALTDELTSRFPHTTVVERDPYLAGVTEYDAYAARITQRRADVMVFAGYSGDAADMVRAVRRAGGHPQVLGSDNINGLDNDTATAREFRGLRYTAFYTGRAGAGGTMATSAFIDAYQREYQTAPDQQAALAYDAATLIGMAEQVVGPNRRRIRDWVANVGTGVPALAGVTGPIRFDGGGDPVDKAVTMGTIQ
jgi:branched-chain amino acid transport system substrate-binding protein